MYAMHVVTHVLVDNLLSVQSVLTCIHAHIVIHSLISIIILVYMLANILIYRNPHPSP